jgi:hypothetical protein
MAGNTYGRVIGIIAGSLGAIGALLSIGGRTLVVAQSSPCVYVVHGIMVYGDEDTSAARRDRGATQSSRLAAWRSSRPAAARYRRCERRGGIENPRS